MRHHITITRTRRDLGYSDAKLVLVDVVGDEPRLPGVGEQVGGQKRRFVAVIHQPGLDAVDKTADEGILPAAFLNEGGHIVGHEVGNVS